MLSGMVKEHLVLESEAKVTEGGRRPHTYIVNPAAYCAFGSFVTPDVYGIGLSTLDGNVVEHEEWVVTQELTPVSLAHTFARFIRRCIHSYDISPNAVLGLGFSSPGPLVRDKGMLYNPHHLNLPAWDVVPIKHILQSATGYTTWIDNLTSTALHGELLSGSIEPTKRIGYLYLDSEIGTEVYIPGTVSQSNESMMGNFGHMIIDFNGEKCACGSRGCLETFGSIDAIYKKLCEDGEKPSGGEGDGGSISLQERWIRDETLLQIQKLLSDYGERESIRERKREIIYALSVGIRNFITIMQPEVMLYGGRVVEQLSDFVETAITWSQKDTFLDMFREIRFQKSRLDAALLIRGGAHHVFDKKLGIGTPIAESDNTDMLKERHYESNYGYV
jgi:predicted NBD/HSP70 family sugar kinase